VDYFLGHSSVPEGQKRFLSQLISNPKHRIAFKSQPREISRNDPGLLDYVLLGGKALRSGDLQYGQGVGQGQVETSATGQISPEDVGYNPQTKIQKQLGKKPLDASVDPVLRGAASDTVANRAQGDWYSVEANPERAHGFSLIVGPQSGDEQTMRSRLHYTPAPNAPQGVRQLNMGAPPVPHKWLEDPTLRAIAEKFITLSGSGIGGKEYKLSGTHQGNEFKLFDPRTGFSVRYDKRTGGVNGRFSGAIPHGQTNPLYIDMSTNAIPVQSFIQS
jgi:hypothetical protein